MRFLFILLSFLFVTPVHAMDISGLWVCSDHKYYYFDKNGDFALPNSKIQTGVSWEYSGKDEVIMRSVYIPASELVEVKVKIQMQGDEIIATNDRGDVFHLKRSNKKVKVYEGEVYYRERIKLPPRVEVRYALYKNNEKNPFMLTSSISAGTTPIPFKIYYVAEDTDKIYLEAKIYHDFQLLFSTEKPVKVNNKSVLLYRKMQEDCIDSIPVPSKYVSKGGESIYFESKGLAIISKNDVNEVVHWSQIDRNHTLEMIKDAKVPFIAPLTNTQVITFKYFDGRENVTFVRENDDKFHIGTFELTGVIFKKQNTTYFRDCITSKKFAIKLEDILKKRLGTGYYKKPQYVQVRCALSRNPEGTLDLYLIDIVKVLKNMTCIPVYQGVVFENTYWRLKKLNGKEVKTYKDQTEPHFILRDKMISGSDGCNNFFMPVEYQDDKISFKEGGSTLMLCAQGEEQANEFINTLHKVTNWEIKGSLLRLLVDDHVVATFEAVYL